MTDFDPYFRAQYPQLVAELDYILGDTDLARDVAQDAFVRQLTSWTRLSRYDKPGAWVRRVALRMAFKVRRRLFRQTVLDEANEIPVLEHPSERTLDVRNAVMQLTKSQRIAVILHYYRDLPLAEVAYIMNVKESTAGVHLYQARQQLARLLSNYTPKDS